MDMSSAATELLRAQLDFPAADSRARRRTQFPNAEQHDFHVQTPIPRTRHFPVWLLAKMFVIAIAFACAAQERRARCL